MRLLNEIRRYTKHFNTKFKYGVIGFYITVLLMVTNVAITEGILIALFVYLLVEGIYGCIMLITYIVERYITKTYKL